MTNMTAGASAWRRFRFLVGDRVAPNLVLILLWLWVVINVALVGWVLLTSVKPNGEVFDFGSLPSRIEWDNYARAWNLYDFSGAFLNTVVIALVAAALSIVVGAPVAFALSRSNRKVASGLTGYIVLGMSIPHQAVLVPYVFANVGVADFMTKYVTGGWDPRITVTLIYLVWSLPFTIFVMTGYFRSMPHELEEAAALDGSGPWRTFVQVMLPMAKSGILTLFILNLITAWNEVLLILILVPDPGMRTLGATLLSAYSALQQTGDWAGLFAGVVIVMAPMLILYSWMGSRVMRGMSAGIGK